MDDHLLHAVLDAVEGEDAQAVALALIGAGILLMADFDAETADALVAVLERRGCAN